jgi:hypothetical protein
MRRIREYFDSDMNWDYGSADLAQLLAWPVHCFDYLKRAEAAGLRWPLPNGCRPGCQCPDF